ncbi:MAG: DUF2950 domain-containing protein [Steroidobacteraceae bacterium]
MLKFSTTWLVVVAFAASIAAATPLIGQQHFATPELAVEALVAASRANSETRLLAILGPRGGELIHSGDAIADRRGRQDFVTAYDEAHRIERKGQEQAQLMVGEEQWPLPIPLVLAADAWHFDTAAGKEEILNRRIGRNELKVIEVCREYVKAQREYAALKIGGQSAFAQKFTSAGGHQDGLYWPAKPGDPQSPLGPLVAEARASGYTARAGAGSRHRSNAFQGYYFRILTAQGAAASGGAKRYLVGSRMTRGFGLIAYPARFGDSGVMTFIVNQNGIVFERNLGPHTERLAAQITEFNPDATWRAP